MFINTYKCEYFKGTVILRIPYELDNVFKPMLTLGVSEYFPECDVIITYTGSSNINLFVYNCMQVFNKFKYYFVAA